MTTILEYYNPSEQTEKKYGNVEFLRTLHGAHVGLMLVVKKRFAC